MKVENLSLTLACALLVAAPLTGAAETAAEDGPLEEITVTAARVATSLSEVAASVTVIDAAALERQVAFQSNLLSGIGKVVPGAQISDTVGEPPKVRGRVPLIKIDNVPIDSRAFGDRSAVLDLPPGMFERVEVVRGADATFGTEGSTGGVINFLTPQLSSGPGSLRVSVDTSMFSHSDGVQNSISKARASWKGSGERTQFALGAGIGLYGSEFDADGDPIADNRAFPYRNSKAYDVSASWGLNIDDDRRLTITQLYAYVDSDPRNLAQPDGVPGGVAKSSVITVPSGTFDSLNLHRQQYVGAFNYSDADVWGSKLNATLYTQSSRSNILFDPDFLGLNSVSKRPGIERIGLGLTVETPIGGSGAAMQWGADLEHYKEKANLSQGVDENAEVVYTDRYTPTQKNDTVSPYVQFRVPVGDRLHLRGGARYQSTEVRMGDLAPGPIFAGFYTSPGLTGGKLTYEKELFNFSAVYDINETAQLYGSYSQALDVTAAGYAAYTKLLAALNTTTPANVEGLKTQPVSADQFEIGVRSRWERMQFSLSTFYSTSKLGLTFVPEDETLTRFKAVRDPRRIWGYEATLKANVSNRLELGGSLGFSDGERDLQETDSLGNPAPRTVGLSQEFITPLTFTGYVDATLMERLSLFAQVTHRVKSGARNQETPDLYPYYPLSKLTMVDLRAAYRIGSGELGLSVENLFNERVFDSRQVYTYNVQVLYPGRRFLLNYTHKFQF